MRTTRIYPVVDKIRSMTSSKMLPDTSVLPKIKKRHIAVPMAVGAAIALSSGGITAGAGVLAAKFFNWFKSPQQTLMVSDDSFITSVKK